MRNALMLIAILTVATMVAADNAPTTPGEPGGPQEYQPYSWNLGVGRAILWDNGDTDGSNGYSHGTATAVGARRAILDDFVIPLGDVAWDIQNLTWLVIWDSGGGPSATGAEIAFRNDTGGGAPAATPFAGATVTTYTETATGRTWFSRAEYQFSVDFNAINVVAGVYWVDFLPIGPENSYAMVRATVTGAECWINYDDYGFMAGSALFGVAADLSFVLNGTVVPVELQAFTVE